MFLIAIDLLDLSAIAFWAEVLLLTSAFGFLRTHLLVQHYTPSLPLQGLGVQSGSALTPRFYLDLRSQYYLGGVV